MQAMSDNEFLTCTERQLSRALGVDPAQLNRAMTGAQGVSLSTIRKWSERVCIPVGRFVELIIERQSQKQQKHC
jgi:transcriptional regulator with XRE-family HTH domain